MLERLDTEFDARERRKAPRAKAAFQIGYDYFDPAGTETAEGIAVTVDISGRGALIEVPCDLKRSGNLVLRITAPFYTMFFRGQIIHSRFGANGLFPVRVQLTDMIEGRWEMMEQLAQAAFEDEA